MARYSNGIEYSGPKIPALSKRARDFKEIIRDSGAGERTMRFQDGEVRLILGEWVAPAAREPRKRSPRVITPAIQQAKVLELVGTHEIAARLEVGPSAVSNWIARGKLVPLASLHCGPVFDWEVVSKFAEQRSQRGA